MKNKTRKIVILTFIITIVADIYLLLDLNSSDRNAVIFVHNFELFEKKELSYNSRNEEKLSITKGTLKMRQEREEHFWFTQKRTITQLQQDFVVRSEAGKKTFTKYRETTTPSRKEDKNDKQLIQLPTDKRQDESTKQGQLNVYYFDDICLDYDNYALYWNKLFPRYPSRAGFIDSLEEHEFITHTARRITGHITPNQTEYYDFEINCRMGCELIIIEHYDASQQNKDLNNNLLRLSLSKEELVLRDKETPHNELFQKRSTNSIRMKAGHDYLIDFTNAVYGRFVLKWKKSQEKQFQVIPSTLLKSFQKHASINVTLPNIQYIAKTRKSKLLEANPKNLFHTRKTMQAPIELNECVYDRPSYIPDVVPEGYGVSFVKVDLLYPYDEMIDHHHAPGYYKMFLEKEQADRIVNTYIKYIGRNYSLHEVVHIEENKEEEQGKRYFIEIDVFNEQKDIIRASSWMVVKKDGTICHPKGYNWNPHEKIYLLTPVKNQRKWIRYLIDTLNDIVTRTEEQNIHLIMVDYNNTDVVLDYILQQALFPYTLLKQQGRFNKVQALNLAVKEIKDEDALMFILDLHLQLPVFIFDYIRKHTFKSRTTYVPILLRTYCGQHPEFTNLTGYSIWQEIGYGMISIFKSDWNFVGGMDEIKFATKWGGEDWDLVERIIKRKIEVIHHRIPGYYHLYHSTQGTWDGTKIY